MFANDREGRPVLVIIEITHMASMGQIVANRVSTARFAREQARELTMINQQDDAARER